jgi:HSP20 family molecular chaperone IbpA
MNKYLAAITRGIRSVLRRLRNLLSSNTQIQSSPIMPETRVPAMDLQSREKDFLIQLEMPGLKKSDIELEVEQKSIEITGQVSWEYDEKKNEYLSKERACKAFYRMVDLPEEIKVDEVTASLNDGVLMVLAPRKTERGQKRKVTIS